MPLTRYEIRNEYSLANPDLYRAAAKDDPEGLLEGVAMAGLVGIVRQLGDLAEFAAEVFHDLHEEVLATAARGHELLIRIQQLEAELPVVEKLILTETNLINFAYTQGVEWHASIRNDQNHLTQGDLPRFIRNSYEDCRGPPRLFLLDKFDVAGAGACLKRYTDPSFFKMEWASSELLKAEKEQQDKRARRIKKKGRQRRNGEIKETSLLSQLHPRVHFKSLNVENLASSSSVQSLNLDSVLRSKTDLIGLSLGRLEAREPLQASSSHLSPQHELENSNNKRQVYEQDSNLHFDDASRIQVNSPLGKESEGSLDRFANENCEDPVVQEEDQDLGLKVGEDAAGDVTSETDHYLDALTTMDSEVETDSESKAKPIEHDFTLELRQVKSSEESNHTTSGEGKLDALTTKDSEEETDSDSNAKIEFNREFNLEQQQGISSGQSDYPTSDEAKLWSEEVLDTEKDATFTQLETENPEALEDIEPCLSYSSPQKSETPSVGEDEFSPLRHIYISPSIEESNPPFPTVNATLSSSKYHPDSENIDQISETPPTSENIDHISETPQTSENIDHISETAQTSEHNHHDNFQKETLSTSFEPLSPVLPLPVEVQSGSSEHFARSGSSERFTSLSPDMQARLSELLNAKATSLVPERNSFEGSESELAESQEDPCSMQAQLNQLPNEKATSLVPERNIFEGSDSEPTESPEDPSPRSPTEPTIRPRRRWATEFFKPQFDSLETDDDLDGMQISSTSPSSSSSMLSSPRPSMLATTVFHIDSEGEMSALSSHESLRSSPTSPMPAQPRSPVFSSTSGNLASTVSNDWNLESEELKACSPTQSPNCSMVEPKHSPPLPPLPPIEWRMMRRFHSTLSTSLRPMEIHSTPPAPPIPPMKPEEILQAYKSTDVPSKHDLTDSPSSSTIPGPSAFLVSESEKEKIPSPEITDMPNPERPSVVEQNLSGSPPSRRSNSSPAIGATETGRKNSLTAPHWSGKVIQDSHTVLPLRSERKDSLIEAISSHDRNTLKKVQDHSHSTRPVPSDDRQVLLEQIRTQSFSLRHTKVEKQEPPCPITNINVAAILEKANAIRQAFAGSDEDDDEDDWSDA